MWLETLLGFKEFLLYVSISAIVTYVLYRRGSFNRVGKIRHFLFVGIGIVFPFVDLIETWLGFEYEGNPLAKVFLVGQYGWPLFILGHLAMSALAFYLGWKGKSEKEVEWRTVLAFLDIFLVIVITMNALLLKLYGTI